MTPRGGRVILTARHSVTAHNIDRIITGRLDQPLSPEGVAHAQRYAELHGPLVADLVISSPAERAIETAALITGRQLSEIECSDLCLERDYGLLQGLNPDQVARYRDVVRYVSAGGITHSVNPPGGETPHDVHQRARRLWDAIHRRGAEVVLVVSHQAFLQQFHGVMLGLNWYAALAVDIRPLGIHQFTLSGGQFIAETLHPGVPGVASW